MYVVVVVVVARVFTLFPLAQAFNSLAKCVAAITVTQKQNAVPVVEKFLNEVRIFKGDEPIKNEDQKHDEQSIFSLRVVGEIGRHM